MVNVDFMILKVIHHCGESLSNHSKVIHSGGESLSNLKKCH